MEYSFPPPSAPLRRRLVSRHFPKVGGQTDSGSEAREWAFSASFPSQASFGRLMAGARMAEMEGLVGCPLFFPGSIAVCQVLPEGREKDLRR